MDNYFTDLFMKFLKDKKTILEGVFIDLTNLKETRNGLLKFIENIDDADMNDKNIRQKFKTLMKVNKQQNDIIMKLLVFMIAYMQGSSFDRDVAVLLTNLGRGEEALKHMFKNKMKG